MALGEWRDTDDRGGRRNALRLRHEPLPCRQRRALRSRDVVTLVDDAPVAGSEEQERVQAIDAVDRLDADTEQSASGRPYARLTLRGFLRPCTGAGDRHGEATRDDVLLELTRIEVDQMERRAVERGERRTVRLREPHALSQRDTTVVSVGIGGENAAERALHLLLRRVKDARAHSTERIRLDRPPTRE